MISELEQTEVSRHKCLIYDGHPSEQIPVIAPLLIDGLQRNLRCLYLGSPEMVEMMESALLERGLDLHQEIQRSAIIFSSDRGHLKNGDFDPAAMISLLRTLIDEAVKDGFAGLCATGDMWWELGTEKNFQRLLEYEALLEKVFREKPLQGICQYHKDLVPSCAIQDALLTHRSAYIGDTLHQENLYYMPPELLLDLNESARNKQGEWMYQQIVRIDNAERKRDKALEELKKSETMQRGLAEALAETNSELEDRVQKRTAQLESANRELEAFSYSVSHDLRAPLRAIDGFSQALFESYSNLLDDRGVDYLKRVRSASQRMAQLIDDMLNLSRVTRTEMAKEKVDLTAMAKSILDELRVGQSERLVEFQATDGVLAFGDGRLLRQVMENLLGNAWKFTAKQPGAVIKFGTLSDHGETVYFVRDNGAGFDMNYASKLFGVFQRLHPVSEFPGTGVGLATVQRIVHRHGGRVWAEAAPGKGATFYFTLG